MAKIPIVPMPPEMRDEILRWVEEHANDAPESVCAALRAHVQLFEALLSGSRKTTQLLNELCRAMGLSPKSERRPSGDAEKNKVEKEGRRSYSRSRDPKERLIEQLRRLQGRTKWHRSKLRKRRKEIRLVRRKLEKIDVDSNLDREPTKEEKAEQESIEEEATEEEEAEMAQESEALMQRFQLGDGTDPTLLPPEETLIQAGCVTTSEEIVKAFVSEEKLKDAKVIGTRIEERVRHDFSMAVNRVVIEVEKKIIVDSKGERKILSATTTGIGPPRFSVTWEFLVNSVILIVACGVPMNRLARMLSSQERGFTASALSKMLRYVARHVAPIYLQLFDDLSDAEILMGDDTSPRVLEVQRHFAKDHPDEKAPWHSLPARDSKRAADDKKPEKLGAMLARDLGFRFPRRNGEGGKRAFHTTVLAGRGQPDDPDSFIVFYRSHLGGLGNLLEVLLERRSASAKTVIVQSDLSTVNLVTDPELTERFEILQVGCMAHARRPFVRYQHEDPEMCAIILDYFGGLAFLEEGLDTVGRNRENVSAVRDIDGREVWADLEEAAELMTQSWSRKTKLGDAANYILRHKAELTAYFDDPRLSPYNNLSERMLRMEKMIEASAMFRSTLDGRFALDILRTLCQTAAAAGVSLADYLNDILRIPYKAITSTPEKFTPYAWAQARATEEDSQTTETGSKPEVG